MSSRRHLNCKRCENPKFFCLFWVSASPPKFAFAFAVLMIDWALDGLPGLPPAGRRDLLAHGVDMANVEWRMAKGGLIWCQQLHLSCAFSPASGSPVFCLPPTITLITLPFFAAVHFKFNHHVQPASGGPLPQGRALFSRTLLNAWLPADYRLPITYYTVPTTQYLLQLSCPAAKTKLNCWH